MPEWQKQFKDFFGMLNIRIVSAYLVPGKFKKCLYVATLHGGLASCAVKA